MENNSNNPESKESNKETQEKQPLICCSLPILQKSKLILILIIIFLIFLFGFGGFLLGKSLRVSKNISVTPTHTPKPTVLSMTTPDETANWGTYTDTKYQYSFKYPKSWTDKTEINENNLGNFTIESTEGERIHGTVFTGKPDLGNDKKNNGSSKSFVIDENKYLLVTYVECDGPGCNLSLKHLDIFDQILSTFKFLDQNQPSDTSNWKIYEGVTAYSGKFSIKYPSSWALKRMEGGVGKGDLLFPLGDINADIINYKAPYILLGTGGHGGGCEKQTRTFTAGKAEYCWGEFGGMAIFEKNKAPYILEAYYYGDPQVYTNEQYKIVFEQILNTFKFLD